MNTSATHQNDGFGQDTQLVLAHETVLPRLRRQAEIEQSQAGELAVTALLNSYSPGGQDNPKQEFDILQGQKKALSQEGLAQGFTQALDCFEKEVPVRGESLTAYTLRVDSLMAAKHAERLKTAGELALRALTFSASHSEYGPARAAAVRAIAIADGVRNGMLEALEAIHKLVKQDDDARSGKQSR